MNYDVRNGVVFVTPGTELPYRVTPIGSHERQLCTREFETDIPADPGKVVSARRRDRSDAQLALRLRRMVQP